MPEQVSKKEENEDPVQTESQNGKSRGVGDSLPVRPDSSLSQAIFEGPPALDDSQRFEESKTRETSGPPKRSASQDEDEVQLQLSDGLKSPSGGKGQLSNKYGDVKRHAVYELFELYFSKRMPVVLWEISQLLEKVEFEPVLKLMINGIGVTSRPFKMKDIQDSPINHISQGKLFEDEDYWYYVAIDGKKDAMSRQFWRQTAFQSWHTFSIWQAEEPKTWLEGILSGFEGSADFELVFEVDGLTMANMRWPSIFACGNGYGRVGQRKLYLPHETPKKVTEGKKGTVPRQHRAKPDRQRANNSTWDLELETALESTSAKQQEKTIEGSLSEKRDPRAVFRPFLSPTNDDEIGASNYVGSINSHFTTHLPVVVWIIWRCHELDWNHDMDNIGLNLIINGVRVTSRQLPSHDFDSYVTEVDVDDVGETWFKAWEEFYSQISKILLNGEVVSRLYWQKGKIGAEDILLEWQNDAAEAWKQIFLTAQQRPVKFDVSLEVIFQGHSLATIRWPTTMIHSIFYGGGGKRTLLLPLTSHTSMVHLTTEVSPTENTSDNRMKSFQGELLQSSSNRQAEGERRQMESVKLRSAPQGEPTEERQRGPESPSVTGSPKSPSCAKVGDNGIATKSGNDDPQPEDFRTQIIASHVPDASRLMLEFDFNPATTVQRQFNTYFCHRIPMMVWDIHKLNRTRWIHGASNVIVYLNIAGAKVTSCELPVYGLLSDTGELGHSEQGQWSEHEKEYYNYAASDGSSMNRLFWKYAEKATLDCFSTWQRENSSEFEQVFDRWDELQDFSISIGLEFQGTQTAIAPWPFTVLSGENGRKVLHVPYVAAPLKVFDSSPSPAQQALVDKTSASDHTRNARMSVQAGHSAMDLDDMVWTSLKVVRKRHSKALQAFLKEVQDLAKIHNGLSGIQVTVGLKREETTTELWSAQLSTEPKPDTRAQITMAWLSRIWSAFHDSSPSLDDHWMYQKLCKGGSLCFIFVTVIVLLYGLFWWLPKRIVKLVIGYAWGSARDWPMESWITYQLVYYAFAMAISLALSYRLFHWMR